MFSRTEDLPLDWEPTTTCGVETDQRTVEQYLIGEITLGDKYDLRQVKARIRSDGIEHLRTRRSKCALIETTSP